MDTKLPVGHAALEGAIEKMTLAGLARAIEVDYQLIQGWRVKSRKYATPAEYCQAVAQKSGIPLHELRPDIYPSPQQQAA